jgi:hypothetical protein
MKYKVELTAPEILVLKQIAELVFDGMRYDDMLHSYKFSDWHKPYSCNKQELNALKRAIEKL